MFLVKNRVFEQLDLIAPKLSQKIIKKSRIKTLVERDSAPQNPKFHHLDSFFNFSYSQQNPKKFALVLFDLKFVGGVFIFL